MDKSDKTAKRMVVGIKLLQPSRRILDVESVSELRLRWNKVTAVV